MVVLKDFSVLEPEQVVIKIGNGENIQEMDFTIFPAFMSLKAAALLEEFNFKFLEIPLERAFVFLAENLSELNPAITETFLRKDCSEKQVGECFHYILQRHMEERTKIFKELVKPRQKNREGPRHRGRSKSAEL